VLGVDVAIYMGGAAAAVLVAGSPNITAVYEVGTRAQQVLETVNIPWSPKGNLISKAHILIPKDS
jgi:hypothetical protein